MFYRFYSYSQLQLTIVQRIPITLSQFVPSLNYSYLIRVYIYVGCIYLSSISISISILLLLLLSLSLSSLLSSAIRFLLFSRLVVIGRGIQALVRAASCIDIVAYYCSSSTNQLFVTTSISASASANALSARGIGIACRVVVAGR